MTFDHFPGHAGDLADCSSALRHFAHEYLVPCAVPKPTPRPATATVQPVYFGDGELLARAMRNPTTGARFSLLWSGGWDKEKSWSEAELALCHMLLFWCSGDADRADRLFQQSELFRQSRWDAPCSKDQTYGEWTMAKAVRARAGKNYTGPSKGTPPFSPL